MLFTKQFFMDKILVTKFYFSNIDMVSSMASNPLKYFYTLSKILLDEKHVPRPPLFLETKQNSQLHYRSDKNHNDSKLCQKVIIPKVSEILRRSQIFIELYANGAALVSLSLILNIFHTLF